MRACAADQLLTAIGRIKFKASSENRLAIASAATSKLQNQTAWTQIIKEGAKLRTGTDFLLNLDNGGPFGGVERLSSRVLPHAHRVGFGVSPE